MYGIAAGVIVMAGGAVYALIHAFDIDTDGRAVIGAAGIFAGLFMIIGAGIAKLFG